MAYSNFTLEQLKRDFGIKIIKDEILTNAKPKPLTNWLKEALEKGRKLPLLSEKARSEQIVTPILEELAAMNDYKFIFYSGINFDVDFEKGLNGECDYILSNKPNSYMVEAPVFGMVEAKKKDVDLGMPQCIAQMIGANLYNQRENNGIEVVYGCVTTGEEWLFLLLKDNTVSINTQSFFINEVEKIFGTLQYIIDIS
jgi:hypothetical protein